MSVWGILTQYREGLTEGILVTLKLCLIVWSMGVVFGCALGWAGARWKLLVGSPSRVVSFLLSGVPALVLLFWLHYPVQAMMNVVIPPFITACVALSIMNTFAVADLVRNVLVDFPRQYILAAQVCGMSTKSTFFNIQLPLVFRQILPGLLLIQVNMLQATLFASLISVEEIFRVVQRINASIYRPIELYSALALFFLAICLPLNGLALWLKKTYTRDMSER